MARQGVLYLRHVPYAERRPEDNFVVRNARMMMTGFGRFDLAFFRHTERWFTVHFSLTAVECFKEIEGNELFWPM